jgi:hypothetical protein
MAYIGKTPVIGNFVKLDAITAVNGQAAYTMQNGGSNFTDYESVNQFLVSLNGTIQAPTDSFTVSGSTLTFASNLSTGDVIDFVMCFGNSLSAGVPTDATVSTAKIVDSAVTTAKINANAVTSAKLNNDIISGATELASEPADTDEFLVSDAGTLKRIDYSLIKGGGITEIDRWKMSNQNYASGVVMDSGWSRYTTLSGAPHGTGLTESSGVFTFPSTGVYEILFNTYMWNNAGTRSYIGVSMQGSSDGFASNEQDLITTYGNTSTAQDHHGLASSAIYDVTNTSNNKLRLKTTSSDSSGYYGTYLTFKKLMET